VPDGTVKITLHDLVSGSGVPVKVRDAGDVETQPVGIGFGPVPDTCNDAVKAPFPEDVTFCVKETAAPPAVALRLVGPGV
jgi:hypothetical protein